MDFTPSYIHLLNNGELEKRAKIADKILESCTSCPRHCEINRVIDERGTCKSGYLPVISSFTPHFGEEPVLSGTRGAGNIFFGNCNLRCVFCQNYEISQNWKVENSKTVSFERLADIMLELQDKGCHNIGLVSPTHFSAQIIKSIFIAAQKGLRLPIIYNTNAYDSLEMLKLYDGIIDIYLPDFKWGDNESGDTYSKVPDYFDKAKIALKEMYNQVGDRLAYDDNNLVKRGLIIRHLVMPNGLAESEKVFKFISNEISRKVHISLMSQYFPSNKAGNDILISRAIKPREYEKAIELMEKYELENGWLQEMESFENYLPEFNKDRANPFNNPVNAI